MALQILNEPGLATTLGQSLNTGLQNLANYKLQNLQQANMARGIQGLTQQNITPDQRNQFIGMLSPQMQQEYLKSELKRPSEEAFARAIFGGEPSMMGEGGEGDLGLGIPGRLTERQAIELSKQKEKREARKEKQEAEAYKSTKPERSQILLEARTGRQNLDDLKRLEELEKTGNLTGAAYDSFLTRSGFDIPALRSPESQEFLKIRQSFLRDAKKYFGARVSNFELEQFLKTIPDLSQSPEGRNRVIANLKRFNRLAIERGKAMKDVIKNNNGIPPLDLEEQVDKKMKKRSNAVADKFKQDLDKKVPKGSSSLSTTLGTIAGEAVGRLPRAAAQGGAGYLAGSQFGGPYGGLIGGGLGFLSGLSGQGLKGLF